MSIVQNTLIDASIKPRNLARVIVELVASETEAAGGFITSTGEEIVERWITETDAEGAWSVNLYPNVSVIPENSYYRVTEKVPRKEAVLNDIKVPASGGPYSLYSVLKEDPGALPPGSSINNHKNDTNNPHAAAGYQHTIVMNEVPSGAINGTNTVFTTANNYAAGKIAVYLNGARQILGTNYTETGVSEITMTSPPVTGNTLCADYEKGT